MTPSVLARQIERSLTGYLDASYAITTPSFDGLVTDLAETPGAVFKGPYLGLSLPFLRVESDAEPFEHVHLGFRPYRHQRRAFDRLGGDAPQSTLVATGTGSGKTESFLLPILDWCARHRGEGVKAILLYPMNALATDQAQRVAALIHGNDALRGRVRAGLYVGQREAQPRQQMAPDGVITDRETLRLDPPDLLLTNYKMLDYLLVRPRDATLWRHNTPDTLRFLVVDELHTFDGAQATDLACLIRRLKDRLKTPEGGLTCVGTSATLGGDPAVGDAPGTELFDYADRVFGEAFDRPDALVVEERESVADFIGAALVRHAGLPPAAEWGRLDPGRFDTPTAFVHDQARLWLGLDPPASDDPAGSNAWAVALGAALKSHALFQNLLKVLGGRPRSYDALLAALGPVTPGLADAAPADQRRLLDSLVALVAAARTWRDAPSETRLAGRTEPFVQVRQDLWLREWRRMVASVAAAPQLAFHDDLTGVDDPHLPVVHCRDCGLSGWGAVLPPGSRVLDPDLQAFYQAFFAYGPTTRFVFPVPEADLGHTPDRDEVVDLCPSCLQLLSREGACPGGCEGPPPFRVLVQNTVRKVTLPSGATANRTTHDCPHCGARNGLTILGSRAASLGSVAIGQAFASPFNDDKKLLAFSDSVQDASHRAGFFGARTYAFNLRRALYAVAERVGEGTPLPELEAAFVSHWRATLSSEAYVATFLAPDMAWLRDYEALLATGTLPAGSDLPALVDRRLAWEVMKEVGYHARIGRTLERAGVALVHPDRDRLTAAVGALLPRLQNELGALRDLDAPRLRRFLLGLLARLRTQGALLHPLLDRYVQDGGNTYFLNKDIALPSLGPNTRAPAFLSTHPGKERRFDALASAARPTWTQAWAVKCFGDLSPLVEAQTLDLYGIALAALVRADLLDVRHGGALIRGAAEPPVWGLRPDALHLTLAVDRLRCDACGHRASAPAADRVDWVGLPCSRASCAGHYAVDPSGGDYYARLYTHGDLRRVVAREHTGLLERDDREALEQAFVRDDRPWAPNLLSCTPTLEMGIDIGDLSTVLLASVPPAQANYLQRVGRAGRRDGNALTVTIAQGQPHDLYFFEDPLEMLAGAVAPPGIYLRAAAVLERQLAAFAFDNWVASGISPAALPARLADVLKNLDEDKATAFPFSFLGFVNEHHESLTERFVALFAADSLDTETVAHLQGFLAGASAHDRQSLSYRLTEGLGAAEKERRDLRRRLTSLRAAERALAEEVEQGVRPEDDLKEVRRERWTVQKTIQALEGRDTLEVLTAEGLLPNYAFPQAGVRLRSVLLRGQGQEPLVYEYERPAAAALSELAPGNAFYANGRAVEVSEVDLAASHVEAWRFCDRCSFSEPARSTGTAPTCPRCGSDGWADAGQVHALVRMRTLQAATSDRRSRTLDKQDERRSTPAHRDLLVDVDPADVDFAYHLEDALPFGLEYVRRARFQELNGGPRGRNAHETTIAGVEAARPGFALCTRCGRSAPPGSQLTHSVLCPVAQDETQAATHVRPVFFYHAFESEAVRFLLPVADDADSERTLASVVAAIELGLRRRFGGRIDHLRTTVQDEPVPGTSVRKRYLVLYDTVPGGTGYLKELTRDRDQVLDVLQRALDALDTCVCAGDPEREACYRCLLQYRNRFDQTKISRALAARLLRGVLNRKDDLNAVDGLRRVGGERVFDSTLEAKFIRALEAPSASPPRTLIPSLVHRSPGHALTLGEHTVGERTWLVQPQVSLGPDQGVLIPSKADFVLYPRRAEPGVLPIAVFTDGLAFHKHRVGLDSAQRMALLRSGRYHVWSLTYDDVQHVLQGTPPPAHHPLLAPQAALPKSALWSQLLASYPDLKPLARLATAGPFDALVRYLAAPAPALWARFGVLQAVVHADPTAYSTPEARAAWVDSASATLPEPWHAVAIEAERQGWLLGENAWDGGRVKVWTAVRPDALASLNPDGVRLAVWLDDTDLDRTHRALWGGTLAAYTLLQFVPGVALFTASGRDQALYDLVGTPPEPRHEESPWDEVADLVAPALRDLVAELAAAELPIPEPGLDLPDDSGRVQVTAELVWKEACIAVLSDADLSPRPALAPSWTLLGASEATAPALAALLAQRPPFS
ncbi:MAG: DEAD/DEAH box helicase [Bacteroidota bacterium]